MRQSKFPSPFPFLLVVALVAMLAGDLSAQAASQPYQPPEGIGFRTASIMSEGVRLHAELFSPESLSGRRLPTVIMGHGWGGNAALLRVDAADIARAGYLVIVFDYRGWGESDGRVILTGAAPRNAGTAAFTAQVTEIRGILDPAEQTDDWFNVIHWAMGEPMVDTDRIGIRGTSLSGGHVVYVAGLEPRVKALVSQVPASNPRLGMANRFVEANAEATRRARGEIGYPEPFVREGGLTGLPIQDKFLRFSPHAVADRVTVPALFLVAENEELYDNADQGRIAFDLAAGPKEYVVLPGITHYGVYGEAREEAVRLAVDWFDRYLKP